MNGLIVPLVGRGLPLGNAQTDHDPGRADADEGGTQRSDPGRSRGQLGQIGDSGIANDTAQSQSIGAPIGITPANASAKATTAETADTDARNDPPPLRGRARTTGEQAATRLFFDSLISSMTTGVDISEIGASQYDDQLEQPADPTLQSRPIDYAAKVARDRFLEGLKLVNDPV